jgi:hypothetical protein
MEKIAPVTQQDYWLADKVIDSDYPKLQQLVLRNLCINCRKPTKEEVVCALCRPAMAPAMVTQIRRTSFHIKALIDKNAHDKNGKFYQ